MIFKDNRFKYVVYSKKHIKIANKRLSALGNVTGKEILDIGTGVGYLPYMANKKGAFASALDMEIPLYKICTNDLNVPVIYHEIMPKIPLPFEENSFDIITSYQACFHKKYAWDDSDWIWFITNILSLLREKGVFVIQINKPGNLQIAAKKFKHKVSGTTWTFPK